MLELRKNERGIALPEVAIALTVVLTAIFGVVELSRLMWTVNALTDGTRQGVRYAVVNPLDKQAVRNVVANAVNPLDPALNPAVDGCSGNPPNSICVEYSNFPPFGLGSGQVTVKIVNYRYNFAIPLVGGSVTLPPFKTTLPAESAGTTPP